MRKRVIALAATGAAIATLALAQGTKPGGHAGHAGHAMPAASAAETPASQA